MDNQQPLKTGIECLRRIAAVFFRDVNFDSLIDNDLLEKYDSNGIDAISGLCGRMGIEAKIVKDGQRDWSRLVEDAHGPLLCMMNNGNWLCVVDAAKAGNDQEQTTIFDPLPGKDGEMKNIKLEVLRSDWSGDAVLLNMVGNKNKGNSAISCLAAVGKHHGVDIDPRRLIHEYAVTDGEIGESLLRRMAADYGMKIRKIRITRNKLSQLGNAFPFIATTRENKYIIICGVRDGEDGKKVALIDPLAEKISAGPFQFWTEQEFEDKCNGKAFLIKRIYSLLDEDRPFGIAWFIPEFLKIKAVFAQIAMAVFMISAIALITPLFFQIVVDKVLSNNSYTTLNVLGTGIIIALLFNSMLEFLRGYLLLFATNKIDISTATKTFRHLMRLPVDFFEHMSSGVLIKHMQQTEKIRGFLTGNLFFTLLELVSLIVFIPFLLLYSVKLTLIVLGFSMLMALVIAALIRPFQNRLHELYLAEGKRQGMLVETIHGIRTIKALALEPVQEKSWNDSAAFAITRYFRVGKISLTAKTISQLLEKSMTVTIIWFGAMAVFDKEMSIGALIAFQMLSSRVSAPLVSLVSLIHEYQQTALSVKMLGNVMNARTESQGGGVHNPIKGNISFENISFRYLQDGPMIIDNLNLNIPAGGILGIVGRSGSGKTTLTKLLQNLYPIHSGVIKIDAIDIREIDRAHLRTSIGVVLQDNYFFHGTVRDNICLTKKSASMEEIVYATRLAGADKFIQELSRGYDSILEENASNLSGGQKQRLAIARALLTNPPILIFDEATSALDPESESIIQNNLRAICKGRTVIIVSHRLSMVNQADMILVLDKGRKQAMAPHNALISQPGIYKDFWQQQIGKFQS